ncbi:hypothetical protein GOODEAATRI_028551, partial [Goodea atripinnis]
GDLGAPRPPPLPPIGGATASIMLSPAFLPSSSISGVRALPCSTNPPWHKYFRCCAPFASLPSSSSSLPLSGRRQGKMAPQKPLSATPTGFLSLGRWRDSL